MSAQGRSSSGERDEYWARKDEEAKKGADHCVGTDSNKTIETTGLELALSEKI